MTKLIIGLGNPGPRYELTRHNVGQLVVDELAARAGAFGQQAQFSVHKRSNALIVQSRVSELADSASVQAVGGAASAVASEQVILAKPRTFMNVSGTAVANLARFFSVQPTDVIMIHDELDLDPGVIRVKRGGGEGGHNGLRSTTQSLGTKDYLRVRVGIGRPPGRQNPADYVLAPFSAQERQEVLPFTLSDAADAAALLLTRDLPDVQNIVHAR